MNLVHLAHLRQLTGTKTMLIYDGLHQLQMVDLQSLATLLKNAKKILDDGSRLSRCHPPTARAPFPTWMRVSNMSSGCALLTLPALVRLAKQASLSSLNQENVRFDSILDVCGC